MPTFPTKGWCPAHGGHDTVCCALWHLHADEGDTVLRHVHQAVSDPGECIALCPVCSPENVAAYRRVPASEVATTAYAVLQKAADQRKQAQAARVQQKAVRAEAQDVRTARQTKLF